jgi:hypothetical protein
MSDTPLTPPAPYSDDQKQQQILDYINQTLGDYQGMNPMAVTQQDWNGPGRAGQLRAIQGLGQLGSSGGLDDISSNQLQNELGGMNQGLNAQTQQMQQGFAGRGMGSGQSGAGLGAGLAGVQQFATPAAVAASQAASASRQRALQAVQQYAQMGGQLRQGDFGANQLGFNNSLAQIQGKAAARNQLGNYYTNLSNKDRAGQQAGMQTGMGAIGLGLGALALL